MDAEQVRLLKSVDPAELGRRIRDARTAKGLTQGQLATGDVSVGYVSRIEAGQRRPQAAVLEGFAAVLGTSVTQLLLGISTSEYDEIRLAVDYAELALESGQAQEAQTQAARAVAQVVSPQLQDLAERARFVHARALESLGRLDDAIDELEELAATIDRGLRRVAVGTVLSRCYRESGDYGRAVDTAEGLLRDLRETSLEGSDEAVQLAVGLAAAHFERGDTGQAVRVCRRALEKAKMLDSPMAQAAAYWNASIMESERGSIHDAIDLAGKALGLIREGSNSRNLARLQSELGILQLRLDPPDVDEALANLERAAEGFAWANATTADRARNDVARARAYVVAGDVEAGQALAQTIRRDVQNQLPLVTADAWTVEGRICALNGDRQGAVTAYRQAVALLTSVGADRSAAQMWFELAGMLEQIGEAGMALGAYRSAAAATGLRGRAFTRAGAQDRTLATS